MHTIKTKQNAPFFVTLTTMIILEPKIAAQEIEVYVREHTETVNYLVKVIDESLNSSASNIFSGLTVDGVLTIEIAHDFVEGRFYGLKISNVGGDLLTYQKIYATAQTDYDKYSVLGGYYTQPTKAETTYITK